MTPTLTVADVLRTSTAMPWGHPVWGDVCPMFRDLRHLRVLESAGWTYAHDCRDNGISAYHYESGNIANSHNGQWEAA